MRPPTVLVVVGSGRSGSTLLERALGEVPGVAALGEVVHIWERGVRGDELCACSRRFSDCPFWSEVGEQAFGGWRSLDVDQLIRDRSAVVRTRHVSRLLLGRPSGPWDESRERLLGHFSGVLRAAAAVAGAGLVVDSSKLPAYAALLLRGDVDLRCLEVVRDPRGVASSMRKQVPRPEVTERVDLMYRTGVAQSALWWSSYEVVSRMLAVCGSAPFLRVRYEDFVADPRGAVSQVLEFAGVTTQPAALCHVDEDRLLLGPNHQVAGNPVRFRTGEVTLRADEAWRTDLSSRDQRVVSVLTAGLRHRHGYR